MSERLAALLYKVYWLTLLVVLISFVIRFHQASLFALNADFYREWAVPARIANGESLYRDVTHAFGPLIPYLSAIATTVIGIKGHVVVAALLHGLLLLFLALAGARHRQRHLAIAIATLTLYAYTLSPVMLFPYSMSSLAEMTFFAGFIWLLPVWTSNHDDVGNDKRRDFACAAMLALMCLVRPQSGVLIVVALLLALSVNRQWPTLLRVTVLNVAVGLSVSVWLLVNNALVPAWQTLTHNSLTSEVFDAHDLWGSLAQSLSYSDKGIAGVARSAVLWLLLLAPLVAVGACWQTLVQKRRSPPELLMPLAVLPTIYHEAAIVRRLPVFLAALFALRSLDTLRHVRLAKAMLALALIAMLVLPVALFQRWQQFASYDVELTAFDHHFLSHQDFAQSNTRFAEAARLLKQHEVALSSCDALVSIGGPAQLTSVFYDKAPQQVLPSNGYLVYDFGSTRRAQTLAEKINDRLNDGETLGVVIMLTPSSLFAIDDGEDAIWNSPPLKTLLDGTCEIRVLEGRSETNTLIATVRN